MKSIVVAATILLCPLQSRASAQALTKDNLYVTGRADLAPSSGGEAGVLWLHDGAQSGLQLGSVSGSVANSWWTYGRAGGHRSWGPVVATASVDLGGGREIRRPFGYLAYKTGIAVRLRSQVVVEGERQYFRVGPAAAERVYRGTIDWRVLPAANVQLGYYRFAIGQVNQQAISARTAVAAGRVDWLGGVVVGASSSQVPLTMLGTVRPTSVEYFAGSQVRFGSYQFLTVVDLVTQEPTTARMLFSVRIPLGSQAAGQQPIVRKSVEEP